MADPVVYDSHLSVFKITDTGNTLRDISDYITKITGLPGERELSETTTLNRTARNYAAGLENAKGTIEGVYSEDANVGSDVVFGPLRTDSTARAFEYYPRGTSGKKYSGSMLLSNYQALPAIGDVVRFSVDFQCTTAITRT